jgi:hypothetical protein
MRNNQKILRDQTPRWCCIARKGGEGANLRFGPLSASWLITGERLEPDAEEPLLAGRLD